jgi:hypothetical protein
MRKDDIYTTRDLASAAFIAYNGIKFAFPYDRTSRSWIFSEPDKCEELDLKLRNGEATVEVSKYESTRRILLGMVKNGAMGKSGTAVRADEFEIGET